MSNVAQQGLLDELAFFSGLSCAASIHEPIERKSYRAASEQKEWQEAMIEEVEALQSQGTWVLVPKPVDRNIVGCKWVYKLKKNADGTISRYKARLVAQGFSQTEGLDYTETFSPIVRHSMAPRARNEKFTGHLPALGFKASHSDPSLFVKESVDVCLLYAFCPSGQLFASQMKFAMDLIERAGMSSCSKCNIQMLPSDG
ncbi:hypothetical protein ACLB2K_039638 [Fragaria x ananassa]